MWWYLVIVLIVLNIFVVNIEFIIFWWIWDFNLSIDNCFFGVIDYYCFLNCIRVN